MTATWNEVFGLDADGKAWGHRGSTVGRPHFNPVGTGAKFEDEKHPRDRLGRFIEIGAEVRLLGGARAHVAGLAKNGKITVKREDNGQLYYVDKGALTVLKRPNGGAPTSRPGDVPAPMEYDPGVAALHGVTAVDAPASEVTDSDPNETKRVDAFTRAHQGGTTSVELPHHLLRRGDHILANPNDSLGARYEVESVHDNGVHRVTVHPGMTGKATGGKHRSIRLGPGSKVVVSTRNMDRPVEQPEPTKDEAEQLDRIHNDLVNGVAPEKAGIEHVSDLGNGYRRVRHPASHLVAGAGAISGRPEGHRDAVIDADGRDVVRGDAAKVDARAAQIRDAGDVGRVWSEVGENGQQQLRSDKGTVTIGRAIPTSGNGRGQTPDEYRVKVTLDRVGQAMPLSRDAFGGTSEEAEAAAKAYGERALDYLGTPQPERLTFKNEAELRAYLKAGAPNALAPSSQKVLDEIAADPTLKLVPNSQGGLAVWGKAGKAQLFHTRTGAMIPAYDVAGGRKGMDNFAFNVALLGSAEGINWGADARDMLATDAGKKLPDIIRDTQAHLHRQNGNYNAQSVVDDNLARIRRGEAPELPASGTRRKLGKGKDAGIGQPTTMGHLQPGDRFTYADGKGNETGGLVIGRRDIARGGVVLDVQGTDGEIHQVHGSPDATVQVEGVGDNKPAAPVEPVTPTPPATTPSGVEVQYAPGGYKPGGQVEVLSTNPEDVQGPRVWLPGTVAAIRRQDNGLFNIQVTMADGRPHVETTGPRGGGNSIRLAADPNAVRPVDNTIDGGRRPAIMDTPDIQVETVGRSGRKRVTVTLDGKTETTTTVRDVTHVVIASYDGKRGSKLWVTLTRNPDSAINEMSKMRESYVRSGDKVSMPVAYALPAAGQKPDEPTTPDEPTGRHPIQPPSGHKFVGEDDPTLNSTFRPPANVRDAEAYGRPDSAGRISGTGPAGQTLHGFLVRPPSEGQRFYLAVPKASAKHEAWTGEDGRKLAGADLAGATLYSFDTSTQQWTPLPTEGRGSRPSGLSIVQDTPRDQDVVKTVHYTDDDVAKLGALVKPWTSDDGKVTRYYINNWHKLVPGLKVTRGSWYGGRQRTPNSYELDGHHIDDRKGELTTSRVWIENGQLQMGRAIRDFIGEGRVVNGLHEAMGRPERVDENGKLVEAVTPDEPTVPGAPTTPPAPVEPTAPTVVLTPPTATGTPNDPVPGEFRRYSDTLAQVTFPLPDGTTHTTLVRSDNRAGAGMPHPYAVYYHYTHGTTGSGGGYGVRLIDDPADYVAMLARQNGPDWQDTHRVYFAKLTDAGQVKKVSRKVPLHQQLTEATRASSGNWTIGDPRDATMVSPSFVPSYPGAYEFSLRAQRDRQDKTARNWVLNANASGVHPSGQWQFESAEEAVQAADAMAAARADLMQVHPEYTAAELGSRIRTILTDPLDKTRKPDYETAWLFKNLDAKHGPDSKASALAGLDRLDTTRSPYLAPLAEALRAKLNADDFQDPAGYRDFTLDPATAFVPPRIDTPGPGGVAVGKLSEQGDVTPHLASNLQAGDVIIRLPLQGSGDSPRYFRVTQPWSAEAGGFSWHEQDVNGAPIGEETTVPADRHAMFSVQDKPAGTTPDEPTVPDEPTTPPAPVEPAVPDGWKLEQHGYDDRFGLRDQAGRDLGSFDTTADAHDYIQRLRDRKTLTTPPDMGSRYLKLRQTFLRRPERRYALKLEEHRRDLLDELTTARGAGDTAKAGELSTQIGQVEQDLRRAGYGQVIGSKEVGREQPVSTRTQMTLDPASLKAGDQVEFRRGNGRGAGFVMTVGSVDQVGDQFVIHSADGTQHVPVDANRQLTVYRQLDGGIDATAQAFAQVPDSFTGADHLGTHLAGFLGLPNADVPKLVRIFGGEKVTPDWRAINAMADKLPAEKWQPVLQTLLPSARGGEDRTFDGKRAADALRRLQAGDPSLPMLSPGHRTTIRVLAEGPQPLFPTPQRPLIYREVTGVVDHVSPEGLTGSVRVVITPDRDADRALDSQGNPLPMLSASVRGDVRLPLPDGGPKVDTVTTPPAPKLPDNPPTLAGRRAAELTVGDRVMIDGEPVTISGSRREGGQLVLSYRPDSDPDTEWDLTADDGEELPLVREGVDPKPPLPVELPVELAPANPPQENTGSPTVYGRALVPGVRVHTGNAIRTVTDVVDDGDPDYLSVTFLHAGAPITAQVGRDAVLDLVDDGTLPTPDRHDRDMDPVRPVLYTYQRRRIVALGLDYDSDPLVAAAAQRIRTRQALSGDEATALAERLRRLATSEPNGHTGRAYRRAADALNAAALHSGSINAGGRFDPGAKPVKGTVRDIGEGDHVAFVNLDGQTVGGKVTALDAVMSGRMYKVTLTDVDGVETTHLLNRDMGTWRLPDLDEPTVTGHPTPAAGGREHITADRVRVGDHVLGYDVITNDYQPMEVTAVHGPDSRGSVGLIYKRLSDGSVSGPDNRRGTSSDGGPSVVRLARGDGSADQPWDSIMAEEHPQQVQGGDLQVGDRVSVRDNAGRTTIGQIDHIDEAGEDATEDGSTAYYVGVMGDDGHLTTHFIHEGEDVTRLLAGTDDTRAAMQRAKEARARAGAIQQIGGTVEAALARALKDHVTNSHLAIGHSKEEMIRQVRQGFGGGERVLAEAQALVTLLRNISAGEGRPSPTRQDADVQAVYGMLQAERDRLRTAYIQSLQDLTPLPDESEFDARTRLYAQWTTTPPVQTRNAAAIATSLLDGYARVTGADTATPGPVRVEGITGQKLKDRIEAYRNLLPADLAHLGQVPTERAAYGKLDIDALERGELPPVVVATDAAPDKAADRGPGHHALAHLDVVLSAGKELGDELRRRTAGAATMADVEVATARLQGAQDRVARAMKGASTIEEAFKNTQAEALGYAGWTQLSALNRVVSFRDSNRDKVRADYSAVTDAVRAQRNTHPALKAAREEFEAAKTARDAARDDLIKTRRDIGQARRDAALAILKDVRPFGGVKLNYHSTGRKPMTDRSELVKHMRYAEGNYPTDWLNKVNASGAYTLTSGVRGKHWGGRTRKLMLSDDTQSGHTIGTHDAGNRGRVATHELGHGMEEHIPGLREMENAILWTRTSSGEVGSREREKYVSLGYSDKSEGSYKDQFPEPYTGKVYEASAGYSGNFEVFTTQMESLLAGSNYHDEQLVDWTLGVLALLGRDDKEEQLARRQAAAQVDDAGNRIAPLDDVVTGG